MSAVGGRGRYPARVIEALLPLCEAAHGLDLSDPARARAELERRLDPRGPAAAALSRALVDALERGAICDRGEPPVRYSRLAKASAATHGFSLDAVHMSGPGPRHRHPQGEVNFCIALEGEPRFDGQPAGWVVEPPGSSHVPTVAGGTMLIVYLLPAGAIEFAPAG